MNCPRCGKRLSILQALTGRKHSQCPELQNEQHVWVERLMNATRGDDPDRKKPLRSNGTASVPDTPAMAAQEARPRPVDPESLAAEIPCVLGLGSWRCRCPRCLVADKSSQTANGHNNASPEVAFSELSG